MEGEDIMEEADRLALCSGLGVEEVVGWESDKVALCSGLGAFEEVGDWESRTFWYKI